MLPPGERRAGRTDPQHDRAGGQSQRADLRREPGDEADEPRKGHLRRPGRELQAPRDHPAPRASVRGQGRPLCLRSEPGDRGQLRRHQQTGRRVLLHKGRLDSAGRAGADSEGRTVGLIAFLPFTHLLHFRRKEHFSPISPAATRWCSPRRTRARASASTPARPPGPYTGA